MIPLSGKDQQGPQAVPSRAGRKALQLTLTFFHQTLHNPTGIGQASAGLNELHNPSHIARVRGLPFD